MIKSLSYLIVFLIAFQIQAQSKETALFIKKELIKQRDALIRDAKKLQKRIDSIDQTLSLKDASPNRLYLTKSSFSEQDDQTSSSYQSHSRNSRSKSTTRTYYRGPRGGCYYINSNGNKTYVARSLCN